MLSLMFLLACKVEPTAENSDAPQITSSVQTENSAPQNAGGNAGGNQPAGNGGTPPDANDGTSLKSMDPNNGGSIGDAVPPENGENIGDPNIPPDTINQTGGDNPSGQNGNTPDVPNALPDAPDGQVANDNGTQQKKKKKPPTFIFNAQSDDSGPLYKAADETCFARKNWDSPPNGTMGDIEARDCPPQMASDAWKNCSNGRLVKHNVGDKEGTCECEPITGREEAVIDSP